ncbi:MAG: hypothetical protein QOJ29_1217 [Thermoleophilaceae bacterium]|nr:hypothetical protein [Thermoleophilaceae bacterium]
MAKLLARRFERGVYVPADHFFEFIQAGYIEPWKPESREQNELVMQLASRVAREYARAGYTTILEGIVLPKWFLDPVRSTLAEAGRPVSYAVLRAPLATCVERAATRELKPFDDAEVIESIWNQFADLGDWEPHAIEVGEMAPEEISRALESRLEAGDLRC